MVSEEFIHLKYDVFRYKNGRGYTGWGNLRREHVDPDIWSVIQMLNRLPFIFTKGNSCSGTTKDHSDREWDIREAIKHGKPVYQYDRGVGVYGLSKGGYQGFITAIVYTRGRPFKDFKEGLEAIMNVELNKMLPPAAQDGIIMPMALQVFVPKQSLGDVGFLTKKLMDVFSYVTNFWINKFHSGGRNARYRY